MIDESDPVALKALQDDIYREKVLRARALTVAERLTSAFECSAFGLAMMQAGVMHQMPDLTEDESWEEVGRRIDRVRRVHDHGLFHPVPANS